MNLKFVVWGNGGNPGQGGGGAAGSNQGGPYFGGSGGMDNKNVGGYIQPANVIISGPKTSSTGRGF